MFTTIKDFLEDVKELYPNFSFEEFNESFSIEEKIIFFKKANEKLKKEYGVGYLKSKEPDYIFPEDPKVNFLEEEAIIIFSLYSSFFEADYKAVVLYSKKTPSIILKMILDEYFENKGRDRDFLGRVIDKCFYKFPYEIKKYYIEKTLAG